MSANDPKQTSGAGVQGCILLAKSAT